VTTADSKAPESAVAPLGAPAEGVCDRAGAAIEIARNMSTARWLRERGN
jgi:hypothetical protein